MTKKAKTVTVVSPEQLVEIIDEAVQATVARKKASYTKIIREAIGEKADQFFGSADGKLTHSAYNAGYTNGLTIFLEEFANALSRYGLEGISVVTLIPDSEVFH